MGGIKLRQDRVVRTACRIVAADEVTPCRNVSVEYSSVDNLRRRLRLRSGIIVAGIENAREREIAVLFHYATSVAFVGMNLRISSAVVACGPSPVRCHRQSFGAQPWASKVSNYSRSQEMCLISDSLDRHTAMRL